MTKKALSLSIVIPVYNEENYIIPCLDAILLQSVVPDEIIVVDNNSTDNSVQIVQKYPQVTLLSETQMGVQAARNTGFDAAKSDIIARIDADTVLPTDWVQKAKDDFRSSSVSAVTGPVSYYDMPLPWLNYWLDHLTRKMLQKFSPSCPFLFGSNMAIRRSVWLVVKSSLCQKKDVHEDLDLAVHLKQLNQRIIYDKKLHAGASARRYDDSWTGFMKYGRMFRESYSSHGIDSFAPRLVTFFYTLGYIFMRSSRRLYDPKSRKRSIKHALKRKHEAPRRNPMA